MPPRKKATFTYDVTEARVLLRKATESKDSDGIGQGNPEHEKQRAMERLLNEVTALFKQYGVECEPGALFGGGWRFIARSFIGAAADLVLEIGIQSGYPVGFLYEADDVKALYESEWGNPGVNWAYDRSEDRWYGDDGRSGMTILTEWIIKCLETPTKLETLPPDAIRAIPGIR